MGFAKKSFFSDFPLFQNWPRLASKASPVLYEWPRWHLFNLSSLVLWTIPQTISQLMNYSVTKVCGAWWNTAPSTPWPLSPRPPRSLGAEQSRAPTPSGSTCSRCRSRTGARGSPWRRRRGNPGPRASKSWSRQVAAGQPCEEHQPLRKILNKPISKSTTTTKICGIA